MLSSRSVCSLVIVLIFTTAIFADSSPTQLLEHVTDVLNPKAESSAVLVVREWENEKVVRQDSYQAFFQGQDVLLLRKTLPEADRGRSILLRKNSMWIELPSARRPLQLSPEQRLTSEALIVDVARANFKRDYTVTRLVEDAISQPLVHVFLNTAGKGAPYIHVELWVEKKTGKPKRATFRTASGTSSKTCEYGSYHQVLNMERPLQLVCSEPGHANWKVELLFSNWKATRLDVRFLTPSAFGKEESVAVIPQKDRISAANSTGTLQSMLPVPEGKFVMGRDNGFPDEQPAHDVLTKAFWIDRTEITVAQYRRFLRVKGLNPPTSPVSPSMPGIYFVDAQYDNFPMVDVSWQSADAYCHWAGKRLPSEAEWEKAARGLDQRLYPWGNIWDENRANSRGSPYSSIAGKRVHFTNEVGSHEENASPYGVLDMSGNVWEWVADWYTAYPGNSNPSDAYGQKYRVIRGGSWVSNSLALTTVARDYSDPAFGYDSIGFRCAKDKNE
jgi:formylglycine-generating enzyme required for sulfatase activity